MVKQTKSSSPYTHARSSVPAKSSISNKKSPSAKISNTKNQLIGKSLSNKNPVHAKSLLKKSNTSTPSRASNARTTTANSASERASAAKAQSGRASTARTPVKRVTPHARISAKSINAITSKTPVKNSSSKTSSKQNSLHTLDNLYEIFLNELHDLYSAENQIIEHMPKLILSASNQKLKEALQQHLQETKMQATRLKKIFQILNENSAKQSCKGMEGVLKEGQELLSKAPKGPTKDACIIAAAQKVEHYEICGYGTARAYAEQLKFDQVAHLLKETLEEEVEADKILSKIAEGSFFSTGVNKQALENEEFALSRR